MRMFKFLISLLVGGSIAIGAMAIPAKRVIRTVKQPDGTSLTIVYGGDEFLHYWSTPDGVPVKKRLDGTYAYARISGKQLQPTLWQAHNAEHRSQSEQHLLQTISPSAAQLCQLRERKAASRQASRSVRLSKVRALTQTASEASPKRKGLVILVNFKDVKMAASHTRQAFDDMMNQEGYTGNGNMGSVHDYFLAQSYGQFDLTFDVVGPVTLSNNLSYYGANDRYGDDLRPAQMVRDAVALVQNEVDFSQYDWDGDGEVDQVFVICAGHSEAEYPEDDDSGAKYIWPHEWSLGDAGLSVPTYNGVKVNTYGCSTELGGPNTTKMSGIGTACHEFSHCLGLPDFYNTDYNGGFGMDAWSLMDYGSYNGDGYSPVGYTAYERWCCGWLTPQELTSACTVKEMPSIAQKPVAYVVYNDGNRNEYFILENRQKDGWLATDEARGMMITHVDYSESAWYNNTVNNSKSHQRCTIVHADNDESTYSLAGDLYPNGGLNTELTDESRPAAKTFNKNAAGRSYLSKPITGITQATDGTMSFDFMGGGPVPPTGISEAQTDGAWNAGTLVKVYSLSGRLLRVAPYANWRNQLPEGVYLLQSGGQTVKEVR